MKPLANICLFSFCLFFCNQCAFNSSKNLKGKDFELMTEKPHIIHTIHGGELLSNNTTISEGQLTMNYKESSDTLSFNINDIVFIQNERDVAKQAVGGFFEGILYSIPLGIILGQMYGDSHEPKGDYYHDKTVHMKLPIAPFLFYWSVPITMSIVRAKNRKYQHIIP